MLIHQCPHARINLRTEYCEKKKTLHIFRTRHPRIQVNNVRNGDIRRNPIHPKIVVQRSHIALVAVVVGKGTRREPRRPRQCKHSRLGQPGPRNLRQPDGRILLLPVPVDFVEPGMVEVEERVCSSDKGTLWLEPAAQVRLCCVQNIRGRKGELCITYLQGW